MKLIIDIPEYIYNGIKIDYAMSEIVHNDCYPYIANGTPIPDNATVCDIEQIRDEIEAARYGLINDGLDVALRIIDKHVGGNDKPVEESEESEFRKKMRLSRGESCYLDQGITQC